MFSWPDPGTRVTVRYRRPPGSVPPLTDAVGRLLTVDPTVRVQTKTGAVVEFAPADVVALRVLTDTPIRTSQIRALERAGPPPGRPAGPSTDSAVPLDLSAHAEAIPEIAGWYQRRGLTPRLAVPDRMLTPPPGLTCERTEQVVVQDLSRPSGDEPGVRVDASVAQGRRAGRHARLSGGARRRHRGAGTGRGAGFPAAPPAPLPDGPGRAGGIVSSPCGWPPGM